MTASVVPRLFERDIDVLLHEELIFNSHLKALIAQKLDLADILIRRCELSVIDMTGETDLLVWFSSSGKEGRLLIENKIDAAFQPLQPERYRERAQSLSVGFDGPIKTILVAPAAYIQRAFDRVPIFDTAMSYEEVALCIENGETDRSSHRASLVRQAIEFARGSYILVPSDRVTELWRRIHSIAESCYSELQFEKPGTKGSSSSWVVFKAGLPTYVTIDWKITKGIVDLSFWKGASHRPLENMDLGELDASLTQSGTTSLIRAAVSLPPSDWSDLSDAQIHDALLMAVRLLNFYRQHESSFS